ncbi:RNA-directed DNA polymerase [Bertholletia excelsa]
MAKRRRRVPEVLWRLFHNRARTLADTIVSLIPSSPAADCRCKARRCLSCSGDGAMTFLIRPNDLSDYRKLLTRCFVVIDINAPPFLAFYPGRRWSQLEILERTIEMMMCNQSLASNVLCRDYDKHLRTSPAIQQLTASAWGLLLRRVGDGVMFYLLKHTSIFLPLPQKRQYQVSGFPVSDFCFKSKYITGSTQGISSFTGRHKMLYRVAIVGQFEISFPNWL